MSEETTTELVVRPDMDGTDHINVYSGGLTELGRLLSNFAHTPFKHPEFGNFASMEGFWYWCGSGRSHDHLRRLYGASAKSAGAKCDPVPIPEEEFHEMIVSGFRAKIFQNSRLLELLKESELPFVHYFVYGKHIVHKAKHDWQMTALEKIRDEVKNPGVKCYTLKEIEEDGYELSDIVHEGGAPSMGKVITYAGRLNWPPKDIIAIRTAPGVWVIARKAIRGLNKEELTEVAKALTEDVMAERKAEARQLAQSLPTDEPRPETPEEAGVVEDPYEIKWDN